MMITLPLKIDEHTWVLDQETDTFGLNCWKCDVITLLTVTTVLSFHHTYVG